MYKYGRHERLTCTRKKNLKSYYEKNNYYCLIKLFSNIISRNLYFSHVLRMHGQICC